MPETVRPSLIGEEQVHQDNLRLSQVEYLLQRIHLWSMPRCLGIVLGNACNIDCVHCYQSKNGDNLLRPPEIASALRRELTTLYPYVSTLRLQGGELFAIRGFQELVEDVAATVRRPILSISTNGTMISEEWAERIVSLPFSNVTISIDGGTPETFAKLRRGANLEDVLGNIDKIQRWKQRLGSEMPYLDSFFVVMRSNFREIPQYLDLMAEHGIMDVSLQTMQVNGENAGRFPLLAEQEAITSPEEIRELHALLAAVLPSRRPLFRMIRLSGLQSLFEQQGCDCSMLQEGTQGLYPDSDDLLSEGENTASEPTFELCPNPWTTLFITEDGGAHLCFLAAPIGNIYETPIPQLWNSPRALEKRSHMIAGRYMASGCSEQWCSWREGKKGCEQKPEDARVLAEEMRVLTDRALGRESVMPVSSPIASVRRQLTAKGRRVAELEAMFQELCQKNQMLHEKGQQQIDYLEAQLAALQNEFDNFRQRRSVKAAVKASEVWHKVVQ